MWVRADHELPVWVRADHELPVWVRADHELPVWVRADPLHLLQAAFENSCTVTLSWRTVVQARKWATWCPALRMNSLLRTGMSILLFLYFTDDETSSLINFVIIFKCKDDRKIVKSMIIMSYVFNSAYSSSCSLQPDCWFI